MTQEPSALQRELVDWMDELESEDVARALAEERLQDASAETPRGAVFVAAARRWLDRGRGGVALALLDRAEGGERTASVWGAAVSELPLETLQLGLPGFGGLPALTEAEVAELRACATPEEALAVVARARARLADHGQEARRLLGRWLERQRRAR